MKDCLVIIDMVNGFVNEGALADKRINKITPNIEKLIKGAMSNGTPIIVFKDTHAEDDEEFNTYPPHCIKGTNECELIPELKKYEKNFHIIEKNTTNGFKTETFQHLVKWIEFDRVIVTGCCTDICVRDFSLSYMNYIKNTGAKTQIIVPENAVETFDAPNHNATQYNKKALAEMKKNGIFVVNDLENTRG